VSWALLYTWKCQVSKRHMACRRGRFEPSSNYSICGLFNSISCLYKQLKWLQSSIHFTKSVVEPNFSPWPQR
jgi:hypothetical protein